MAQSYLNNHDPMMKISELYNESRLSIALALEKLRVDSV